MADGQAAGPRAGTGVLAAIDKGVARAVETVMPHIRKTAHQEAAQAVEEAVSKAQTIIREAVESGRKEMSDMSTETRLMLDEVRSVQAAHAAEFEALAELGEGEAPLPALPAPDEAEQADIEGEWQNETTEIVETLRADVDRLQGAVSSIAAALEKLLNRPGPASFESTDDLLHIVSATDFADVLVRVRALEIEAEWRGQHMPPWPPEWRQQAESVAIEEARDEPPEAA